jgi:hypothetical protein
MIIDHIFAGAVLDLAPESRFAVGPVSSKWLEDGGRKQAKTYDLTFLPPVMPQFNVIR